ncbi:hypothetical protein CHS0354_001005 [Potamilus streckersoni]|uniref:Uncharacterized protein n=1 Tax=Potamilus streckersoni TaxID=2493646 RepID=A0AAE0SU12_9BIVA|nr:hypothetical protein CHS0354_001005 [Potamilus streckersoni]
MPLTKKAEAASKVSVKRARPSRSKVQESAKRPRKKAPSSTPTANNPQYGSSTEGAFMDQHLINVITQQVSDRLTTQMKREMNNKFDHLVEMLRSSTENSPQTGYPYVPFVPKENTAPASMVSYAIVENTSFLTGTAVDAGNVLQIIHASGALSKSHFVSSSVSPSALKYPKGAYFAYHNSGGHSFIRCPKQISHSLKELPRYSQQPQRPNNQLFRLQRAEQPGNTNPNNKKAVGK